MYYFCWKCNYFNEKIYFFKKEFSVFAINFARFIRRNLMCTEGIQRFLFLVTKRRIWRNLWACLIAFFGWINYLSLTTAFIFQNRNVTKNIFFERSEWSERSGGSSIFWNSNFSQFLWLEMVRRDRSNWSNYLLQSGRLTNCVIFSFL